MCSFWHGRAVMTSAAYEEAYTTRGYEVGGLFGIEEIEKRKAFDEKVHTIQYQANAAALWSGFEKEVRVCAKVRQVLPVRFLWNWKGMQHRSE